MRFSGDIYFYAFCFFSAVSGAAFGSFANVMIFRLPRGESVVSGGSHCEYCMARVRPSDNIPVLSYFFLRGKCRVCGGRISARYPIVEGGMALLWLFLALFAPRFGYLYSAACMSVCLFAVTAGFIDMDNGFIPDVLSVAIAVIGAVSFAFGFIADTHISPLSRLAGFAVSFAFYGGIYILFRIFAGREGMGFGDVKFMTACGLFLGVKAWFFACITSSVAASAVLVFKGQKGKEYPFAPYLAAGVILAMFLGEWAAGAYLSCF